MDAAENAEIGRKAKIAWEFIKCTPEFPQSPDNSYEMMRFISNAGMECTVENFRTAFRVLQSQGKIKQPKVSFDGNFDWNKEQELMSFEEAQKLLDGADDFDVSEAVSKSRVDQVFSKPLLLPKKATVVWDKEFAKKVLTPKGPVVKEPAVPVVGEKKPRKFKE
jgi:hypothetical protein